MIQRIEGEPNLVRTASFFDQSLSQVADALIDGEGIVIATPNSGRRVRVTEVEEFPKVGSRWNAISKMQPGDLWNPQYIRVIQSLVVTKGDELPGACVRICEAEYFDPTSGLYVPRIKVGDLEFGPKESHIAAYLGLSSNTWSRLVFINEPNILFVLPR